MILILFFFFWFQFLFHHLNCCLQFVDWIQFLDCFLHIFLHRLFIICSQYQFHRVFVFVWRKKQKREISMWAGKCPAYIEISDPSMKYDYIPWFPYKSKNISSIIIILIFHFIISNIIILILHFIFSNIIILISISFNILI